MSLNRISLAPAARLLIVVLLAAALLVSGCGARGLVPVSEITTTYRPGGDMKAPEFPTELAWINTTKPLRLQELRGKFVLLDFWTYCCINCMHIIPKLKRLEAKYSQELVVIGVHSAKFAEERDTDNIRQAVARYEIEHPVVNDRDMVVWQHYGARAWPTLVLIDPEGQIIHTMSGEMIFEPIDKILTATIPKYEAAGALSRAPLDFIQPGATAQESLLAFPGKVLADEKSGRLFISDSNHNRILVVSLQNNTITATIGSGEAGLTDGDFDTAAFNHPQGMALAAETLYVADTENHALRAVNLADKRVTTIAGTGAQAQAFNVPGPGPVTPIASPWDLVAVDGALYIAMAGPHQIWKLNLADNYIAPYAGSGREARVDGPLPYAALAQPSGITTDGEKLYFADSEVSSIRSADLDPQGEVTTIAGGDLFDFGDRDAVGRQARLQHPLGVVYQEGALYVADTYNNKIKRITLSDGRVETLLGTGEAGLTDGSAPAFYEPGGLTIASGKLYIADTNNHVIRVADLAAKTVATLQIKRPSAPAAGPGTEAPPCELVQTVAPGPGTLKIALRFPPGYYINEEAPSLLQITCQNGDILSIEGEAARTLRNLAMPADLEIETSPGLTTLHLDFTVYYCGKIEGLCYYEQGSLDINVQVKEGAAANQIEIAYNIPVPE